MEKINRTIDDINCDFYCWTTFHSSGFTHHCNLVINGYFEAENIRVFWINRTWESWTYQSVCKKAINILINDFISEKEKEFKAENGYKKLTEKRKADFLEYLENIKEYQFYKKLREALR